MNKLFKIARREYVVMVRRKAFLITALLMPLFIAGIAVLPGILAKRAMERGAGGEEKKIAVIDLTGQLYGEMKNVLQGKGSEGGNFAVEEVKATPDTVEKEQQQLNKRIETRQLDAYLVIGKKVVTSHTENGDSPDYRTRYYCRNVADMAQSLRIMGAVRRAVVNVRLREEGIDPAITEKASGNIHFDSMAVKGGREKKTENITQMFGAFAFMMLLFFALQITGQGLMQGLIEEKNSRVIEVLLSSVSPKQLMIGKILGLGAVGLTVVMIWSVVGYSAARIRDIDVASLPNFGFFVVFFLLGYAFFATLMSAVGSVCNSDKEAQQMMAPVMLLLVIPLVVWFYIAAHPDGNLGRTLSVIPFTAPMAMMLRIAVQVPPRTEIALSVAIMLLSIGVAAWAATKIFRTGILMYGKRPRLREIVKWVRYK